MWVPHLRRGLIAAKVGSGVGVGRRVALTRETHLSDDEAVAKVGHPGVMNRSHHEPSHREAMLKIESNQPRRSPSRSVRGSRLTYRAGQPLRSKKVLHRFRRMRMSSRPKNDLTER